MSGVGSLSVDCWCGPRLHRSHRRQGVLNGIEMLAFESPGRRRRRARPGILPTYSSAERGYVRTFIVGADRGSTGVDRGRQDKTKGALVFGRRRQGTVKERC